MILVTGATGQVGREAAAALLSGGDRVRVLVRDPAAAEGLAGADVAQGTFEDEASIVRAMPGIDVLLLAGRDNPGQVEQHERVLRAAENAGVGHVVKLSAVGASATSPIELMRHHAILEQRVRDGSMHWTVARPHLFLQNLLRAADVVRATGRLSAPMGDARAPLVDTRDVGAALAAILAAPERHEGATYSLTGPVAVGYHDVAAAMSRMTRRPIEYVAVAPDDRERELLAAGVPPWRARDLAGIASAYSEKEWAVTPELRELLGRPPRSLEQFLADHHADFGGAAGSATR